jgi:competence ComEA-like helix-hairpin-helix protein
VIYNLIPRFLYKYPDSNLKRNDYILLNVNSISTHSSINNKASQPEKDTPYSNQTSPWKQTWKERNQRPMIKMENMGINLNAADSMALVMQPGIGPILSARIIKYRNKLGGFYTVAQLKEVHGISDSTFEKISPKIEIVKDSLKK